MACAKDRKAHDGPRSVLSSHGEPLLPGMRKSNQMLLRAADEVFELYGSLQLLEEKQWKMLVLLNQVECASCDGGQGKQALGHVV